jgi:hypothetical protein
MTDRDIKPANQCMGCQAGWPMVSACYQRREHGQDCACRTAHAVRGGYTHELVGCTAGRYGGLDIVLPGPLSSGDVLANTATGEIEEIP